MKEAIDSAVEFLRGAVQTYPQVSEDEPGGYCSEFDMQLADVLNCVLNMQSRLESLEKDAARLDWLESSKESHGFCHLGNDEYRHYAHQSDGFKSVREVIDTAMQS